MFFVIVKARVKPDKVDIYESTFKALRETVLENEPGVTFYALSRVPDSPCEYRLVEAYENAQVQEEHFAKDYYQAAVPVIMACLEDGSFEMEVFEAI